MVQGKSGVTNKLQGGVSGTCVRSFISTSVLYWDSKLLSLAGNFCLLLLATGQ